MIPYNPKDANPLCAAGDYQATIKAVTEKDSKAGNRMHELEFIVYNGEGTLLVFDYIVYPKFVWKLKRLAVALGALEAFEAGTFDPAEYEGRNLTLNIGVDEAKDGYDAKNSVKGYAPKAGAVAGDDDGMGPLPF